MTEAELFRILVRLPFTEMRNMVINDATTRRKLGNVSWNVHIWDDDTLAKFLKPHGWDLDEYYEMIDVWTR